MKVTTLFLLGCALAAYGEQQPIDKQKSVMTVHVAKAGVFSALGHDHEISAPVAAGSVDTGAHKVELRLQAGALKVLDPKTSEKDRAEIQKTMLGPDVLDVAQYPEISFQSTGAESSGNGSWKVRGSLTLHGQSKPVVVDVSEKDGHYVGTAQLKQTDFGIKPVRVAGGTVRVKDELRIEFDIQLAHSNVTAKEVR